LVSLNLVYIFSALILNNLLFTWAMWFRSFSLLSQSSFGSSIVQNTSNIKFFYISSKRIQTTKNILPFNTYQMKKNLFPKNEFSHWKNSPI